jgi:integrase
VTKLATSSAKGFGGLETRDSICPRKRPGLVFRIAAAAGRSRSRTALRSVPLALVLVLSSSSSVSRFIASCRRQDSVSDDNVRSRDQGRKRSRASRRQACPRGLRHGFSIGTLQARVPINLTRILLGHSSLATEIYTAASGPEELFFMQQFWLAFKPGVPAGSDTS